MNIVQAMPASMNENDQDHAQLLALACGTDNGNGTNIVSHSGTGDESFSAQQAKLLKADLDALFQTNTSENFFQHSGHNVMGQFSNSNLNHAVSPVDQSPQQQATAGSASHNVEPYSTPMNSFKQDGGQSLPYNNTNESLNYNDFFAPRPDMEVERGSSTGHQHLVSPPSSISQDPYQQPQSNEQKTVHSGTVNGNAGTGNNSHHLLPMQSDFQSQAPFSNFYSQEFSEMSKMPTTYNHNPFFHSNQHSFQNHLQNHLQEIFNPTMPDLNGSNQHNVNAYPNKRSVSSLNGSAKVGEDQRRKAPRKRVKRSDDMPRYPLSAYNFFFSEEREVALALLTASPEDYEEVIPDSVTCSSTDTDSTSSTADTKNTAYDKNEFPSFKNQNEEFDFIQGILASRKMNKSKMEKLKAKIKANTLKKLNTLFEGDKVKKSHKKSHGKITFQVLSRLIGQRWRSISDASVKQYYFDLAKRDQERYNAQMKEYKKLNKTQN
jgi:hypothetical protein